MRCEPLTICECGELVTDRRPWAQWASRPKCEHSAEHRRRAVVLAAARLWARAAARGEVRRPGARGRVLIVAAEHQLRRR